uniref:Uncharacterized protein n=1 Tax=Panagrolaimus sp. JU765 TaxID=591449 RepID=A0AC34QDS0_9BILA
MMKLFVIFCVVKFALAEPSLDPYFKKQTRVTYDNYWVFHQDENQYENPPVREGLKYTLPVFPSKNYPPVRMDFSVNRKEFSSHPDDSYAAFHGGNVLPLKSDLYYSPWHVFHLKFNIVIGNKTNKVYSTHGAEIMDVNFPCNDASEDVVKSWAFNGRQIMYSIYFNELKNENVYVFVNINDDICEYHVKYSDIERAVDTYTVPFARFKGLHLTAPEGYKIVHPLMSVDSVMGTLNYVVVNRNGPVDVMLISYRFYSEGTKKPLRWEKFDATNHLLPRFREQKFFESEGSGKEYDYQSLEFFRHYDFRVHHGSCPKQHNGVLASAGCVHFFSVFYQGNEIYDLIGMPARKAPCRNVNAPKRNGFIRNFMYLDRHRCFKTVI